jgi:hypothetical protein
MADYIPNNDAMYRSWLTNFQAYAAAHAAALGLSGDDTLFIGGSLQDFETADDAHVAAMANAKSKREAKDLTRRTGEVGIRGIVRKIQANPDVTDEQRAALGITVPKAKTPPPPPTTRPLAEVENVEGLQHILRFSDSASGKHQKPEGVKGAEIYMKIVRRATPPRRARRT